MSISDRRRPEGWLAERRNGWFLAHEYGAGGVVHRRTEKGVFLRDQRVVVQGQQRVAVVDRGGARKRDDVVNDLGRNARQVGCRQSQVGIAPVAQLALLDFSPRLFGGLEEVGASRT